VNRLTANELLAARTAGCARSPELMATIYYLLTEHLTHVTQAIPHMFLLACPLMHWFGHRHGSHRHDASEKK
jgi:hypothetical protein